MNLSYFILSHSPATFFFVFNRKKIILLQCHLITILSSCVPPDLLHQVPLICETKPMISIQQMMTYQNQKNGCYQPPPPGSKHDPLSPDVARLIQLEEGIRPAEKKKHAHSSHHKRDHRDKDHCSVDMNGLETNV